MEILDKPNVKILDVSPKIIDYKSEILDISFDVGSDCYNASLFLNKKKFDILAGKIGQDNLEIHYPGKRALSDKLKVKVECYDLLGREYVDEKDFEVEIVNINFWGKIKRFFVKLFS